jgi:signal transduction histidine kinase
MVVALFPDTDDTLWIGTYEGGLIRLRNDRFTTFTTRDGLANNVTGHFTDDAAGNLWIGSVRGLMRISKAALHTYSAGQARPLPCLTLTVSDGMFSQICSGGTQPVMAWANDGRLWVPNMKAIAIVDPAALPTAAPARVVLEERVVDGRIQPANSANVLRVPFGKNHLELHYTALRLSAPENMRFRFKLEGWDNRWVEAGAERVAHYSALPSGEYRFRVMAGGRDGEWTEAPVPLVVRVIPRFWQSGWFQAAGALAGLALIAALVLIPARRKARRDLERLERAHALERERARIAQDIHDELGAGLAQIGLLADLGQGETADPGETRRSLVGIGQRARASVMALDEIVWAVDPGNDNLPRLADYLCRLAEECFENTAIRCQREVPTGLPRVPIQADTRHNLILAVKEALTNALRHAHAPVVSLRLIWNDPNLVVLVEDNGSGFDPAHLSDLGNGLCNQRTRLRRIGGTVELTTQPGMGTRVLFQVPLAARRE